MSVVEADPSWPAQFSLLRDALLPVVGDLAVTVEHVGSTAVPGLAAKPVLDVDVVVPDATARRAAGRALAGAGWRPEGDLGIEGRDAFAARPGLPPHHLYVVVDGSPAHRDHVDLRDHLRSHPADALAYAAVKRAAAHLLPHDRAGYQAAKAHAVDTLLATARGDR